MRIYFEYNDSVEVVKHKYISRFNMKFTTLPNIDTLDDYANFERFVEGAIDFTG